ncbi:MAG TPA: sigma-70 family RNA polymerase sigma factor [Candidatus Limnocylindria bacterium]|nr:sigma-70 family RNA polymerase sigma factor [Candidatus Limnocylindria bacterium]
MKTGSDLTDDSPTAEKDLQQVLLANLTAFQAFAQSRLGDKELASDVVQDALLKALRSESGLTDDENLLAWFYRILRNTITDLHRKRASQAATLAKMAIELNAAPDEETRRVLCGCLASLVPTLKPEYAEVVRRIDFEERDSAAVAENLGITLGNLKVRLHRGRQQLKERLIETCQLCATHGCLDCHCEAPA